MASGRAPVKFSYTEYLTLPEGSRQQLIEGDLVTSPAPTRRHQTVVKRLSERWTVSRPPASLEKSISRRVM